MKSGQFLLAIAVGLSFAAGPVSAAPVHTVRYEPDVARCIRQAAKGSPWLEKTLWGLRDQEGGWVGAEVANSNGSHDLGVLQVNSAWVSRIAQLTGRSAVQVRGWLIYDPCFNVEVARWIFLSALGQTQDYWQAVGIYHSPTALKQKLYVEGVAGHLRNRFGIKPFNLLRHQTYREANN